MSKRKARTYYYAMLYGMQLTDVVDHECLPYTKPSPTAADVDLTSPLVRLDVNAANTNLCEEFV